MRRRRICPPTSSSRRLTFRPDLPAQPVFLARLPRCRTSASVENPRRRHIFLRGAGRSTLAASLSFRLGGSTESTILSRHPPANSRTRYVRERPGSQRTDSGSVGSKAHANPPSLSISRFPLRPHPACIQTPAVPALCEVFLPNPYTQSMHSQSQSGFAPG